MWARQGRGWKRRGTYMRLKEEYFKVPAQDCEINLGRLHATVLGLSIPQLRERGSGAAVILMSYSRDLWGGESSTKSGVSARYKEEGMPHCHGVESSGEVKEDKDGMYFLKTDWTSYQPKSLPSYQSSYIILGFKNATRLSMFKKKYLRKVKLSPKNPSVPIIINNLLKFEIAEVRVTIISSTGTSATTNMSRLLFN